MFDQQLRLVRSAFPDLPRRALQFFGIANAATAPHGGLMGRTVWDFYDYVKVHRSGAEYDAPAAYALNFILNRLVDAGILIRDGPTSGLMDMDTRYVHMPDFGAGSSQLLTQIVDFVVYGFPAVIDAYGDSVFQLVTEQNGHIHSGTAFASTENTLLTAAHCVAKAENIAIVGLPATALRGSVIYYSRSEAIDCAVIVFATPLLASRRMPLWNDANVLDDVLVIGYPNIPTLRETRVVEKATIASVLRGTIAAKAMDILGAEDLLLITARVRGGFSGGPLITSSGFVVGMVSRQPIANLDQTESERYDNQGYGMAISRSMIGGFLVAVGAQDKSRVATRGSATVRFVDV